MSGLWYMVGQDQLYAFFVMGSNWIRALVLALRCPPYREDQSDGLATRRVLVAPRWVAGVARAMNGWTIGKET